MKTNDNAQVTKYVAKPVMRIDASDSCPKFVHICLSNKYGTTISQTLYTFCILFNFACKWKPFWTTWSTDDNVIRVLLFSTYSKQQFNSILWRTPSPKTEYPRWVTHIFRCIEVTSAPKYRTKFTRSWIWQAVNLIFHCYWYSIQYW